MFSSDIPDGWKPPPPPKHGSVEWKDMVAFQWCSDMGLIGNGTRIVRLPSVDGVELGYMAIRYHPGPGTDYFRVDEIEEPNDD